MLIIGCNNREAEKTEIIRKVRLATVCQADSVEYRSYSGIINEKSEVGLAFRVAGPIQQIAVDEGDYVRKGQLVARIDSRDYEIQLKAAQGQYEKVKAEAERVIELRERNSVAGNDYDKAVAGLKMAEANLEHAKDQINDTKLSAPFSGYIHEVNFEEGEMVDAGMPVASLLDVTSYEVEVELPLSMYANRKNFVAFTGKQPSVSENEFSLQLAGFSKKANNNQLYSLKLRPVSEVTGELMPGMNTEVTIAVKTGFEGKLCVPLNSVFKKNGETYVWVFSSDGSVVKSRRVTIGELTGENLVTLTSGVQAGEKVVAAGVHHLQENQEVEILENVSETNVGGML
jgi:RND family efflux transporter MFP subunit